MFDFAAAAPLCPVAGLAGGDAVAAQLVDPININNTTSSARFFDSNCEPYRGMVAFLEIPAFPHIQAGAW